MRSAVRFTAFAFAVLTLAADGPARAQCSYPQLFADLPQAFSNSPTYPRFNQVDACWAAVAVRSDGAGNWDIGLSITNAPFPTCMTLPVVASQQPSGIDFVLGDFAVQGTGLRYAPVARASGTGGATVEWDNGVRVVDLATYNNGPATPTLIDCWTANLVAGASYQVYLWGDNPGDYSLHVFKRGPVNSWRQKSDAIASQLSNYSYPPGINATTTDRYAFVIVNETGTTSPYMFLVQTCTDPPDLANRVSQAVPWGQSIYESPFEFNPELPGYPTVAVRTPQLNGNLDLNVWQTPASGFYPCEQGTYQTGSGYYGTRVDFVVGDQASGAITPGATYAVGVAGGFSAFAGSRIEYDDGTDSLVVDGPTRLIQGGPSLVVRTMRVNLEAGVPYSIHIAKPGVSQGRFHLFRPFDTEFPAGNGWLTPQGQHAPLIMFDVDGINDIGVTPPVTGPYAIVLTSESGENVGWELGVSTCLQRWPMADNQPMSLAHQALVQPGWQRSFGTQHVRSGWSAVAGRSQVAGEDWVLEAWRFPTAGGGAPPFGCLSGLLGTSTDPALTSRVDFLARYDWYAGDVEYRIQTEKVHYGGPGAPTGGVDLEFQMWNNFLAVDDMLPWFPMPSSQVFEVWNVELTAGQPYTFHFSPAGFAGEIVLMKTVLGCTSGCTPEILAMGGPGQVFRTTGDIVHTPTESGLYGLFVLNQDGGGGQFSLGLSHTTVDAGGVPPASAPVTTRLRAAAPSPTAGGATLLFDLARPARVGFEVIDLAGRVVARIPATEFAAGRGQAAWGGTGDDGRRLAAGLYFVRMRTDGAATGAPVKVVVR